MLVPLVVFPTISALVSLICAGVLARDALARPRPDRITWAIAFAVFGLAAACEVLGTVSEWTPVLARTYYLSGAVLVVGYLALGELYLLAADKIQRIAPGAALLVTAFAATIVWNAPVDQSKLAVDGWEALERGPALSAFAITINSAGTSVIVGGLVYSAIRFKRLGIQRNRMIGCLLIALGTITVGMGGTLTRLGYREYLDVPMAIGSAIIFAGIMQTRRPDAKTWPRLRPDAVSPSAVLRPASRLISQNGSANGHGIAVAPGTPANTGLDFIEEKLVAVGEAELSELCRIWSAGRRDVDALNREEAKRAWALRSALSTDAQQRFDALPAAVQWQLSELYHDVLTARA